LNIPREAKYGGSQWVEKDIGSFLKILIVFARCQWLMPIILATQEAEIRITVQSQTGQIVCKTLFQKNPSLKKGWWSGSM
jgi:hypothetical protein